MRFLPEVPPQVCGNIQGLRAGEGSSSIKLKQPGSGVIGTVLRDWLKSCWNQNGNGFICNKRCNNCDNKWLFSLVTSFQWENPLESPCHDHLLLDEHKTRTKTLKKNDLDWMDREQVLLDSRSHGLSLLFQKHIGVWSWEVMSGSCSTKS